MQVSEHPPVPRFNCREFVRERHLAGHSLNGMKRFNRRRERRRLNAWVDPSVVLPFDADLDFYSSPPLSRLTLSRREQRYLRFPQGFVWTRDLAWVMRG